MIRRALFWSCTWISLRAWSVAVRASLIAPRFRPERETTVLLLEIEQLRAEIRRLEAGR